MKAKSKKNVTVMQNRTDHAQFIILDLENEEGLPPRDASGKGFSDGEKGILDAYRNDYTKIDKEISCCERDVESISKEAKIALDGLKEFQDTYTSNKEAFKSEIKLFNDKIEEEKRKMRVKYDIDPNKDPDKDPDKIIDNQNSLIEKMTNFVKRFWFSFAFALFLEAVVILLTYRQLSYSYSKSDIIIRCGMVGAISILILAQAVMHYKYDSKIIQCNFILTHILALVSMCSVIAASFTISSSHTNVSFSLSELNNMTNVAENQGVLAFLENIWLSLPGLYELLMSIILVTVSKMICDSKGAHAQKSKNTRDVCSGERLTLKILKNKKEEKNKKLKELEGQYEADMQDLKDFLSEKKKLAEDARERLSELRLEKDTLLSSAVHEIKTYHSELAAPLREYWRKTENYVFPITTKEDVDAYFVNSIQF